MAASAESVKLTFAPFVHDRFGKDASRGVSSAKKQDIVGARIHGFTIRTAEEGQRD
jgi:hypothetical protein